MVISVQILIPFPCSVSPDREKCVIQSLPRLFFFASRQQPVGAGLSTRAELKHLSYPTANPLPGR